jgi:hypothetical protein
MAPRIVLSGLLGACLAVVTATGHAQVELRSFDFAYSVDSGTDALNRINLHTGEVRVIGALHPDPGRYTTPIRLARRRSDGALFAVNNSPLSDRGISRVDPSTGRATLVVPSPHIFQAIAFDGQDRLLGQYQHSARLVYVDLETGEVSEQFGSLPLLNGLAWNPIDGELYAPSAGGTSELYRIGAEGAIVERVNVAPTLPNSHFRLAISDAGVFWAVDQQLFQLDPATGRRVTDPVTLTFPYIPQGMVIVTVTQRSIPALSTWSGALGILAFCLAVLITRRSAQVRSNASSSRFHC